MAKRFMKYNPAFLSEKDLVEGFVVRHADLELIIGIISENVTAANQHVLVIGPRGSGKTTLVLRVAAEIERDKELRERWHPLIFSEESYEVVSAGEFWLEALFHLAEQTDDEKWRRTYVELKEETDDQRLGERARAQLLDFADGLGKRILLIVENLNMLFSDLISEEEAWKIRHTLINEPRLMLLATATSRFENIENSSHAMFEMFKMQELKPLDDEECNRIWELITGRKLIGEQIRPIRILTGGSPRLLTIIAKFSAHRSFRQLLDDLVDLIDDHTEYFKSHLDNLPAVERKVYLALAGLWDASTARDIAKAARLDVNKTSSLLARLVGRGAVVVEEHGKKNKWYMVAERMYNIYYLMRRRGKPADRVKAAVKFMVSMYDPESAARLITEEACRLSPELCRDHYLAFGEAIKEIKDRQLLEKIISDTPKNFLESPYVKETLRNFTAVDIGGGTKGEDSDIGILNPLFIKLNEAVKHLRFEEGINVIDEIIARLAKLETDDLQVAVLLINIMIYKGTTLGALGRTEQEIAVYDQVVAHFADAKQAEFREPVAVALVLKGSRLRMLERYEEAEKALLEAIALEPHFTAAYTELIKLLLKMLERREKALQTAEEIISRKPEDVSLLNGVSMAFYNDGDLSLLPKAEQWARQAVALAPENASAHHTLACILCVLDKGNEALESARNYIQDTGVVEKTIEDAIELFVELAASGYAKEALAMLVQSPAARHLEPLVVGLKLYIGEDVKTAVEIREVAKDVVKRIEERVQKRE